MTYSEKLRDPRWQKKRLVVMERDDFKCRHCGDPRSTLNVHHRYYKKGAAPWDYDDDALITLCENCHRVAEDSRRKLLEHIGISWAADTMAVPHFKALISNDSSPFVIWSDPSSLLSSAIRQFSDAGLAFKAGNLAEMEEKLESMQMYASTAIQEIERAVTRARDRIENPNEDAE